jgi:signal peptidase I
MSNDPAGPDDTPGHFVPPHSQPSRDPQDTPRDLDRTGSSWPPAPPPDSVVRDAHAAGATSPFGERATPAPMTPTSPYDAFRNDPHAATTAPAPDAYRNFDDDVPGDDSDGYTPSYYDDPAERYADVPAALELAYTDADLGLSPRAYDRAYPYEVVQKRRRASTGARYRRVGRELAETVILALLIFFAVKAVIQNFRVEGASMEPTMHNNDYLLVNKALYFRFDISRLHDFLPFVPDSQDSDHHLFRAPRRGDVIVFRFPLDPSRDFIKRVIGVPGDTVEVHDEQVYINGAPLKEDYILATPNYTYGPKTVPHGMYFVLGDNRRNSFDSHAWGQSCSAQQQCDFVPEENIIGQAWVSYWPFDALGFVKNEDLKPQAP